MKPTNNPIEDVPYLVELRRSLVKGIARRRRRRTATVAAAVVAATGALALVARPGGENAALAIERTRGWIELRVRDATASPRELTRELRGAGIDGVILVVPVEPARVGTWVAMAEFDDGLCNDARAAQRGEVVPSPEAEARTRLDEAVEQGRDVLRIRASFAERPHEGFFAFLVGRSAAEGEKAQVELDITRLVAATRCGGPAS